MQRKIKNTVKGLFLEFFFYIHFNENSYSDLSKSFRIAEIFLFFGALPTEGVSVFSGNLENILVGVTSCPWFQVSCGGVSKLSPDRLRSRVSLTFCELSNLIHKLLFFKLGRRDGLGCVLSGLNLGLGSALVEVQIGDGLMGILEILEAPKDLLSCHTLGKYRAGFHRKEHSHNCIYI